VQGVAGGGAGGGVTVQYREFGVRLQFVGEIISDSLIKLSVIPEVSSLDFANGILLQGFRIPALRTRRVNSKLDVRRNQSLVISGMFNTEDEIVRTGVPILKDLPLIGGLFGSTRTQQSDVELMVIVTPVVVDPMNPRAQDLIRLKPDTSRPALDALKKRIPPQ
jgi:pilus assembly protein CpaC